MDSTVIRLRLVEKQGDIFNAPNNTLLIHACNCQGNWDAGIAKAFKEKYPDAYKIYREHCLSFMLNNESYKLRGSSLLIKTISKTGLTHYIGCLFTSNKYGRLKDSSDDIVSNSKEAMKLLVEHILELSQTETISEMRICRINSVNFGVEWAITSSALQSIEYISNKSLLPIIVYSL